MIRTARISPPGKHAHWLRDPIDVWSDRRIVLTASIAGALVFAAGTLLWQASDLSGTGAAQAALDDTQARLTRSRAFANELPAMRQRAAASPQAERWTASDALHQTTLLATQSGLRIGTVEPLAQMGGGLETQRPLRLRAEGSFAELRRFLSKLESLPRLVIPADIQMKRGASGIALETTLRVFDHLPPVVHTELPARGVIAGDPFGSQNDAAISDAAALQLVGTFLTSHRSMALVQTASGVDAFAPGAAIGSERLGSIRRGAVELSRRDGAVRTISLSEGQP